jgi:hypothetical protein
MGRELLDWRPRLPRCVSGYHGCSSVGDCPERCLDGRKVYRAFIAALVNADEHAFFYHDTKNRSTVQIKPGNSSKRASAREC